MTDFTKNRRSSFKNEFSHIFKRETLGIGKINHFESEKNYSSNCFFLNLKFILSLIGFKGDVGLKKPASLVDGVPII